MSWLAQASATLRPVATLPVKETLSTPPLTMAAPVSPSPSNTWNTPSGKPALLNRVAARREEKGVTSEPFATTALPARRACTAWFIISTNGAFQGVIRPTTPSGL